VLVLVLLAATMSSRAFCRVLCPIGAMLAPFNYISLWKIRPPTEHCRQCAACREACPEGGRPGDRIAAGVAPNRALDCIVCHECQKVCPEANTSGVSEVLPTKPGANDALALSSEETLE